MNQEHLMTDALELGASEVHFTNGAIAILTGFTPTTHKLSAYYLASHKSYLTARALLEKYPLTQDKELLIKPFLHQNGIAFQGANTLCATQTLGSYFAAQVLLSPYLRRAGSYAPSPCTNCGACAKACPTGAITPSGFIRERCMRHNMENKPMPLEYMQKLDSLLGCELCQRACPRNTARPAPLPPEVADLFEIKSILENDPIEQRQRAALVGKNMLSSKRLQVQALILAANQHKGEFANTALQMTQGNACEMAAADYYQERNTKARKV